MKIRRLRSQDLSSVIKIENSSFPSPWSKQEFSATLKLPNVIGNVVEIDQEIVGYIIYEIIANAECLHVLNLAVSPDWRRQGVGKALIQKMMSSTDWLSISLMVSDRNLDCHLFLKKMAFEAFSVARDYFAEDHDAYEFMYLRPMGQKKILNDEACTGI